MKSIAAALLLLGGQAAAAQDPCLPPALAGRLAAALLPSLIEAAAGHCASHLPAGAYLGNGSRALAERLRSDTAANRAAAAATLLEFTGQAEPEPGQDPDQVIGVLTANLAASLDAAQCRGASEMLEALAPLPTANVMQALAAALGVAAAGSEEDGPPICRE
ncbi:MAG TPA: hypothetical protein VEW25_14600 [Allosphingosinicella sp.]|nr:hypothetical protein [Allosphingosinicella sp.]